MLSFVELDDGICRSIEFFMTFEEASGDDKEVSNRFAALLRDKVARSLSRAA